MGGINPNIALSYQAPQFQIQNPIQTIGSIYSLKNLMTEGQLKALQIQQAQLTLAQAQREEQQRKDYAAALAQQLQPQTATAAVAAPLPAVANAAPSVVPPAGGAAPTMSDLMNLPTTDRAAQMGALAGIPSLSQTPGGPVQVPTPDALTNVFPAISPPAPAPSLGTLMTPSAPAVPAPVAAPAAPVPVTDALSAAAPRIPSATLGLSAGEFLARYPDIAPGILESQNKFLKAVSDQQKADHENQAAVAKAMGGYARGVEAAQDKPAAFNQAILDAVSNHYLTSEQGRVLQARGYRHDDMTALIERADDFEKYHTAQKDDIESLAKAQENASNLMKGVNDQATYSSVYPQFDPRVQKMLGPVYSSALRDHAISWTIPSADLAKTQATKTAQMAQLLTDPSQIPGFIAAQPAEVRPYLQKLADSGTLDQFKQGAGLAAIPPAVGETVPKPASVIEQEIGVTGAKKLAEIGAEAQAYDPVVKSVLNNDVKLQDLPPDIQSKIIRPLVAAGYTGLGKRVSDQQLGQIDAYNNMLTMLRSTQTDLQNPDSRSYMGIASGVLSHVPFVRDRINKIQGDLSLTQQKLKGFITNKQLRGLNEQTLEQTFPTVTLTPGVNDYRVNKLIQTVEQERDQYLKDLGAGGKVLPSGAPVSPPAATPPAATAPTSAPVWQSPVKIEIQKPAGSASVELSPAQQTALPATPPPPGKVPAIKPDGKGGWKGGFINAKDADAARRMGVIVP